MSFDTVEVAGSSPVVPTIFFSGLEPLPHLSSPGFNLFWSFFDLTPALKPPVEDNRPMLPTPGVRGFYLEAPPRSVHQTGLEAIKYGARTEVLFI